MSMEKWFADKLKSYEKDPDFLFEKLILDLTETISKRMKEKKVNRTKLAKRLNVSPPAVTKILNGNSNFTLKTLLSLADALDQVLKIDFEDKRAPVYQAIDTSDNINMDYSGPSLVDSNVVELFSNDAMPNSDAGSSLHGYTTENWAVA